MALPLLDLQAPPVVAFFAAPVSGNSEGVRCTDRAGTGAGPNATDRQSKRQIPLRRKGGPGTRKQPRKGMGTGTPGRFAGGALVRSAIPQISPRSPPRFQRKLGNFQVLLPKFPTKLTPRKISPLDPFRETGYKSPFPRVTPRPLWPSTERPHYPGQRSEENRYREHRFRNTGPESTDPTRRIRPPLPADRR